MGLARTLELGFGFAGVPISVAAEQSRRGSLAASQQFIPELQAGRERRGGEVVEPRECRDLWYLAGPNLRRRDGAARRAPIGCTEEVLTCQKIQLQHPRPGFISLSGTPEP